MQTIIKGQWLLIVGLLANKCLSKEYRHPIWSWVSACSSRCMWVWKLTSKTVADLIKRRVEVDQRVCQQWNFHFSWNKSLKNTNLKFDWIVLHTSTIRALNLCVLIGSSGNKGVETLVLSNPMPWGSIICSSIRKAARLFSGVYLGICRFFCSLNFGDMRRLLCFPLRSLMFPPETKDYIPSSSFQSINCSLLDGRISDS